MKTVSKAFRDALSANTREEKLSGNVTFKSGEVITLTEDNIVAGSTGITSVFGGEDIEFGIVIVKEVRIGIYSDVDRYAFSGAKLNLNYALKVDGAFVEKTLGSFDITSAEREGKKVVLTGYSPLGRLNKEYDGVSVGGSPFEVIEYICKECGIEMAQTKNDFNDFINTNERIHLVPELNLSTYRDCLRAVLQLIGAFADSDENGKLIVKKFAKEPVFVIGKNQRYSSKISDYKVQFNALKIKAAGEYVLSTDPDVELGLEMLIENAPMWKVGKKDLAKPRCDNLFGELKQIVYTPSSFLIPGDITLECGDMISLKMDADEEINTLIMAITWQYRGKMSVESTGRNPHFKGVKSGNTAIIHELQQQNANNKMVFYEFTNIGEITVGEQELETIGKITFTTVEDTAAMFLAEGLINCNAPDVTKIVEKLENVVVKNSAGAPVIINDPSGNPYSFEVTVHHETLKRGYAKLEVYYYLNNNLIEYRPAEEMLSGQHILSLYYSFSKIKKNTVNVFEIKMKSTGGKITIPKERFRASIAGQGLVATVAWDGQILITDYVGYFDLIRDNHELFPLRETVTAHTQVPVPTIINEKVRMFDLGWNLPFDISKIKETITAGTVVTKQTITPEMLTGWQYNAENIYIKDGKILTTTEWLFDGAEVSGYTGGGKLYECSLDFAGINTISNIEFTKADVFSVNSSEGMEVIRNNQKSDEGIDTLSGVDWFTYNGNVVNNIYVNGNSWIGFGTSGEHLKVNRRDAAVYSVFRQETENYLKIRWEGYSNYSSTSDAHKLVYDVYLFRNGDILLAFRNIPTSYDDGTNSLGSLSFNMNSTTPYVLFTKQDSGSYTVSHHSDFNNTKYLVKRDGEYLKFSDGAWTPVEGELNRERFITHGMNPIDNLNLLIGGGNFSVIAWSDTDIGLAITAKTTGGIAFPEVITTNDYFMTHSSILGIETVISDISDDLLIGISFDEGATYKAYNGAAWVTLTEPNTGMTKEQLTAISVDKWSEVATTGKYRFRFVFQSTNSYFEKMIIDYANA